MQVPAITITKEECYDNKEKARALTIRINKVDIFNSFQTFVGPTITLYQEADQVFKSRVNLKSPRETVEVCDEEDQFNIKPELALMLVLQFESNENMINFHDNMQDILNQQQSEEYRMLRDKDDRQFWANLKLYAQLLSHQVEFWKFPAISEEHFLKHVDTGDLMLFRTNNQRIVGSWITRAYTKSHFDHIGMVMRFGDSLNQLYIFEAVGDTGVRMIGWNSLRRELYTNGFFEKICTRKLNYEMTNERL